MGAAASARRCSVWGTRPQKAALQRTPRGAAQAAVASSPARWSRPTTVCPIETIKVGDLVRSEDEKTGGDEARAGHSPAPSGASRDLRGAGRQFAGRQKRFDVTDDHPWMGADGHWRKTLELVVDLWLKTEDGRAVRILSVGDTATRPTLSI